MCRTGFESDRTVRCSRRAWAWACGRFMGEELVLVCGHGASSYKFTYGSRTEFLYRSTADRGRHNWDVAEVVHVVHPAGRRRR